MSAQHFHLAVGLAFAALAVFTGYCAYRALVDRPVFGDSRFRYWDWNLWSICQCYAALIGAAVFIPQGLG